MKYDFLVETYETEGIKVVSVWSEFTDEDLPVRPCQSDPRGRSVHEQMVHQCVSEDLWFRNMLGIDVSAPPLPQQETRLEFMKRYAHQARDRRRSVYSLRNHNLSVPRAELTEDEMILRLEIDRGRGFLFSDTLWQLKRSPRLWQWPFRTFSGREH